MQDSLKLRTQNIVLARNPEMMAIRNLLHKLGLTENRVGFYYIEEAVCLSLEDPTQLLLVTKRLYPETARRFQTSWQTVERSIRYCIGKCWKADPERLQTVLDMRIQEKPVPAVFLSLLCAHLQREGWSVKKDL